MSIIGQKFTRKYAPKKLSDVILPKRIMSKIERGAKQHQLYFGSPGTGKTSTAVAMAKGLNMPYLYINSSEETSVDVIREKISKFCSTMSIMDGDKHTMKIVILDECLDENEEILIGDKDNPSYCKMKDLHGTIKLPSFNMETHEIENDEAIIISDKEADIFQVELEDGRTINVTSNHPFLIDKNGNLNEFSIDDGLLPGMEIVTVHDIYSK